MFPPREHQGLETFGGPGAKLGYRDIILPQKTVMGGFVLSNSKGTLGVGLAAQNTADCSATQTIYFSHRF